MRRLAAAFLLLALCGASHAVEIKNEYFHLNLPGDWREEPGASAEQFVVVSDSRKAQVTVSYVPLAAASSDLERVAQKLLELRRQAELEAASDRQVILTEPWTSRPSGGGIQVNYLGHDSLGRHFFFAGFVTETHVTSVTGELEFSNEASLHAFYQEVLSNFGY